MTLLLITIVLFTVFVAIILGTKVYLKSLSDNAYEKEIKEKYTKLSKLVGKTVYATPAVFLILLTGLFTSVGPNQVGVIFDELNGGIQEKTFNQGLHAKSIFQKVTNIDTSNQIRYVNMFGQSKDGNSLDYEVTLTFYIEVENAGKFFRKTNNVSISEAHLNTLVKEAIQKTSSKYEVFDILGSKLEIVRKEIEDEVRRLLMNEYFVTLSALTIEDVDVGEEIELALKRKAEEKLKLEIAEQERIRANVEAETKIIKAENEAAIILLTAQANSEAQAILNSVAVTAIQTMYQSQFEDELAKADFEVNNIGGYLTIQEIGEIVIKQLYYDVWDGKLPTVITDGNGIIIQP